MGLFTTKVEKKAEKVEAAPKPPPPAPKQKHPLAMVRQANPIPDAELEKMAVQEWKRPYPSAGLVLVKAAEDVPSLVTAAGPVKAGQVVVVDASFAEAHHTWFIAP